MAERVFILPMVLYGYRGTGKWVGPAYVRELGLTYECIANARSSVLARVSGEEKLLDELAAHDDVYEPDALTTDKRSALSQELTARGIPADLTARERLVPNLAAAINARRNAMTEKQVADIFDEIAAKADDKTDRG